MNFSFYKKIIRACQTAQRSIRRRRVRVFNSAALRPTSFMLCCFRTLSFNFVNRFLRSRIFYVKFNAAFMVASIIFLLLLIYFLLCLLNHRKAVLASIAIALPFLFFKNMYDACQSNRSFLFRFLVCAFIIIALFFGLAMIGLAIFGNLY